MENGVEDFDVVILQIIYRLPVRVSLRHGLICIPNGPAPGRVLVDPCGLF